MMQYVRDRLAEPGTWTGLTLALVAFSLSSGLDLGLLQQRLLEAAALTAAVRAAMKG